MSCLYNNSRRIRIRRGGKWSRTNQENKANGNGDEGRQEGSRGRTRPSPSSQSWSKSEAGWGTSQPPSEDDKVKLQATRTMGFFKLPRNWENQVKANLLISLPVNIVCKEMVVGKGAVMVRVHVAVP